jgi:hypothetical protein
MHVTGRCTALSRDVSIASQALCAAVVARCRLHAAQGAPDRALLALQQALPRLDALRADAAAVQYLWLLCLAAAVLSERQDAGDVLVGCSPKSALSCYCISTTNSLALPSWRAAATAGMHFCCPQLKS